MAKCFSVFGIVLLVEMLIRGTVGENNKGEDGRLKDETEREKLGEVN